MRTLLKPTLKGKDVFLNCIAGISDVSLQTRLKQCASLVDSAEMEFESKVVKQKLHTIGRNKSTKANKNVWIIGGKVTINEMKNVYTQNFVPKDSPGRSFYDKLLLSAKNGKCPLCGHRIVTTIDHHLPKAYYPLMSVVPVNLVPSCTDCNKSKLGAFPNDSTEETLHPYYDDVEKDLWLKARVLHSKPPSLEFFVDPPTKWPQLLSERAKFHFKSFSLNSLYAIEAANELGNIQEQLVEYYNRDGLSGVQNYLADCAKSRSKASLNSWQTAMYNALASDSWFCDGGFL